MKSQLKLKITKDLLILAHDLKKRNDFDETLKIYKEKGTIEDTLLQEDANKLVWVGGFYDFAHFIEVVQNTDISELEENYLNEVANQK